MNVEEKQLNRYRQVVADILENDKFISCMQYIHHSDITCLHHAVHVSYVSFVIAEKWGVDPASVARGALLHDFYLYDWHKRRKDDKRILQLHGFRHPKIALQNARSHFNLNKTETDIIYKHMWPLTLFRFPVKKASAIVSLADKYCTVKEMIQPATCREVKALVAVLFQGNEGLLNHLYPK